VHKNENAKNYFTCNDTSIGNLGFLEFTDTYYLMDGKSVQDDANELCHVIISSMSDIEILSLSNVIYSANEKNLLDTLHKVFAEDDDLKTVVLRFSKTLSFQDYISIKSTLMSYSEVISNKEILF
jgi:hypothetical protein